jgi:uncharacterized membrane protein
MPKSIPTRVGDVLIVGTTQSYTTHAVGLVSQNGQQDFDTYMHAHVAVNVQHVTDRAAAIALAKTLVAPGRRIVFHNLDTGEWSEISKRDTEDRQDQV